MAYVVTTPELGIMPITQTSTILPVPLGTIIEASDSTLGAGKFMLLGGVASTVVGSVVSYNQLTGATTLVPNTANLGAPLAVAMSANVAVTTYGWYQVQGAAVIKKTAVKVSPAVKMFISGTAGRLMSTVASGKQVLGVISINAATVASATSTITCQIAYPLAQGQVV